MTNRTTFRTVAKKSIQGYTCLDYERGGLFVILHEQETPVMVLDLKPGDKILVTMERVKP